MIKSIYFKRITASVLVSLLLVIMLCTPALAASIEAVINSSTTKVYQSPNTSAASVNGVKGVTVTVTAYKSGWARISYKGHEGYIEANNLDLKSRITAYTYGSTPMYVSASSSSEVMITLDAGTTVYIVGVSGSYARVQNKSGSVTGYIQSNQLASRSQLEAAYEAYKDSGASASIEPVASLAVSLAGRPYGTDVPNSFTSASLIRYCYGMYGYQMKDSTAAIAEDDNLKKITTASSVRCGDILCFDGDGDGICDHVAIYLGKGYFCEANPNSGKVQINTVSSWYKSHLMFAKRV